MSTIHEESLGFLYRKIIRGKDKSDAFLRQKEFYLEVKEKRDRSTTATTAPMIAAAQYQQISNDSWFHISKHIPPEDVQTFALICQQTAALVRTKSFWRHLFKKYCQQCKSEKMWILSLPAHLQYDNICNYDGQLFRASVIEALFYCHDPFKIRTNSYTVDFLLGRTYISAWQTLLEHRVWIVCYQFRQHGLPQQSAVNIEKEKFVSAAAELVNDWESLAILDSATIVSNQDIAHSFVTNLNPYEGVCLLVIFVHRFIPIPAQLTCAEAPSFRLAAVRRPLTSNMREHNLELDFVDSINRITMTAKYPVVKHKVLPWWHPDFKKYLKYDDCDKFL